MNRRIIIVDDEPPARQKIRRFLADTTFQVLAEAGSVAEALPLIKSHQPDLLFLDVQMPGADGFELLAKLGTPRPRVIFSTAYDHYALKAFDVHAVDYLLKPYDRDRFNEALRRAQSLIDKDQIDQRLDRLLADTHAGERGVTRILVREGSKIFSIKVSDLTALTAEEKYVRLHTQSREHLQRDSLTAMYARLDQQQFCRIHRGAVINLAFFDHLETTEGGDYQVILRNSKRFRLGRNYREAFLKRLEQA